MGLASEVDRAADTGAPNSLVGEAFNYKSCMHVDVRTPS